MTENELLQEIKKLAKLYHWKLAHFRPAVSRESPLKGEHVSGWGLKPQPTYIRDVTAVGIEWFRDLSIAILGFVT